MKRNRIEESLYNAVISAPLISFEELAAAPFIKMSEHDYITKQENRNRTAYMKQLVFATAMCLVLLLPLSGWFYQNRVSDSVITMDVNPSIKITTNRKDHVLSVIALNEDARKMIGDSDYKDTKLDDTVANLLDLMMEQSYISTDKNTILLTVMNKDMQKADKLLTSMDSTIREQLKARSITPTILKQIISKEANRSGLAEEYHISEGKMKLIQDLLSQKDSFTLDMLAGMSMEQLYRLARENALDLSGYLNYEDTQDADTQEYQENNVEDTSENSGNDNSDEDSLKDEDNSSDQEKADDHKNEDSQKNDDQNQDNEDQDQDNDDQDQDNENQNQENEDQNQDNGDQNQDNGDQSEDNEDQNQGSEVQNDDNEDQDQDSTAQFDENEDSGEGDQGSSIEDQEESGLEDSEEDSQIDENPQESTIEENNGSEDNNNQYEENSSSEGDQENNSASEDD